MDNQILTRVAQVMGSLLNVDPATITNESSPGILEGWDSMVHVQLIMELEKQFSISINPDDAVEFESVGMICKWLESKVGTSH